jgi:hypothetical protein
MVRTVREDWVPYLGPFRSRIATETVVHAIWDAAPIRRCNGVGTKGNAACSFAQLGKSLCPCDGSLNDGEYDEVVDRVTIGMTLTPAVLLDSLRERMIRLAEAKRYEDAAEVRDRYQSLGRAIEHRRAWQALMAAGTVWAEDDSGDGVVVRHGHLVASWNEGSSLPLVPMEEPVESIPQVPESVATAEEVHLIWRWMNRDGVRIVQSTAPLKYPITPVPALA